MNATTASVCLLMCCLLSGHVAAAMDNPPDLTPALTAGAAPPPGATHPWVSAGAGCLGGAALGTVLPGIGNILGCIAGGASMWWLRHEPTR